MKCNLYRKIIRSLFISLTVVFSGMMLILAPSSVSLAQNNTVSGTVTDGQTGDPLVGVNILVVGTSTGTATNSKGHYSFNVPSIQDTLRFSFIGYQTQTVPIDRRATVNIALQPSIISGQQLVVVGFGTKKKANVTGAISSVGSKEIQKVPVFNVAEALQGRAAGVQVTHNSGQPGSRIQVRIRGNNSMIGNNSPLYVVNGFPIVGGIDFLSPSDIKSIDVLKDAMATAIYGSRGANGVVEITTKSGTQMNQGQNHILIKAYYGVQNTAKRYKVLTPKQYAIVVNTRLKNSGKPPFFDLSKVSNHGTNWQDLIFRPAPVQNYNLGFSGGSKKTNYSVSANYFNQRGIVYNSGDQRGSVSLNLHHQVKKWLDYAVNINLSRRKVRSVPVNNQDRGNGLYSGALSAPPTVPPRDENGLPTQIQSVYSFGGIDMRNPLLWRKPYKDINFANTVLLNNALNFTITPDLSFNARVGLQYENSASHTFTPIIYKNDNGSASEGNTYWNSLLSANTLKYNKDFANDQNLKITAGLTYQSYRSRNSAISVSGFPNNITQNYNLGAANTVNPPGSGFTQWKLLSGLSRASYSLHNTYFITASLRADGSSRFGANHKWGIFPAGAVAWRVSNESFMENVHFISNLKLRVSYGKSGNTAIAPYQSLARLSSSRYIYEGQTFNIGYSPSSISNPLLKWETTKQLDIGLNLSILNDRLGFTFDYYKKKTDNLLASVPLPPSVGFSFILENVGKMQNKGVEFTLNANILNRKSYQWNISAQISRNRNKLLKIAGGSDIVSSGLTSGLPGYNLARVGKPLGVFYGYLEDGYTSEGQIKYVDENGDGKITPADRVILGSPYPDFTYGLNTAFSYKGFGINVFIQGSYGNKLFWRTPYTNLNSFQRGQNQLERFFGNYWTPQHQNAKYPIISTSTQMRPSDRFVKDASYLRVKSLKLSYSVPSRVLGTSGISQAQIYLKATNLFTLTDYPGLNPVANTRGNDSHNIKDRLKIGTDETSYPYARIFGAGIIVKF